MGTRGFIGFVADGQEKIAYNHWDSYPSGLGITVLEWLREAVEQPGVLGAAVRKLRVVDIDKDTPTDQDIQRLAPFTDTGVGRRSTQDWYCLLRGTQGNPGLMLEAGVIEDAGNFPRDSLFAEWGYIIDLDGDGWLEVYEGFQKSPHQKGRFASRQPAEKGYYPVRLKARWPLASLPGNEEFLEKLGGD